MSDMVPSRLKQTLCRCGWRYPAGLDVKVDGSEGLRKKVAGEPLSLFISFKCPDCGEVFRLEFSTDRLLPPESPRALPDVEVRLRRNKG